MAQLELGSSGLDDLSQPLTAPVCCQASREGCRSLLPVVPPHSRPLLPAVSVLTICFKSGFLNWRLSQRLTAQLGSILPLFPATPSGSRSTSSTALSGHATPPTPRPRHAPYTAPLGPAGGSAKLRLPRPPGPIKRSHPGLPFANPQLCLQPCSLSASSALSCPLIAWR